MVLAHGKREKKKRPVKQNRKSRIRKQNLQSTGVNKDI